MSWILLLALFFRIGGEASLYLWFEIDQRSFTEYLCENVNRPELDCHGKCQLEAMVATADAHTTTHFFAGQLKEWAEAIPQLLITFELLYGAFRTTSSFFYSFRLVEGSVLLPFEPPQA